VARERHRAALRNARARKVAHGGALEVVWDAALLVLPAMSHAFDWQPRPEWWHIDVPDGWHVIDAQRGEVRIGLPPAMTAEHPMAPPGSR